MSFSDLMSSGKGPGVIGLLLALVVLAGFLVLGTLALDERFQGGGETIESKVRQMKLDIENLKSDVASASKKLSEVENLRRVAKNLASTQEKLRTQEESIARSLPAIRGMHEEISALERDVESHKSRYRESVRNGAKGKTFAELKLLDGQTLHDVTVRVVNAMGMQVMHRDGVQRIPYDNLPLDMQDLYLFEPEEMKAAANAEAIAKQAQQRADAAAREAARQALAEKEQAAKEAETVRKNHARAAMEARVESLGNEIRALESAIQIEAQKTISRAPIMRQDLARLERERADLQTRLRAMRSDP